MLKKAFLLKGQSISKEDIDWEVVYREQLPRVYNYFRFQVADEALAEDLTSLTFEKAWSKRNRYRNDLGKFSTWLFTIAQHVAIDNRRTFHLDVPLEDVDLISDHLPIEDTLQQQSEVQKISTLLERLPARERELIALKYGAEMTNRAIAQQTGLSETNVGTILSRVVQKLRASMEVEK